MQAKGLESKHGNVDIVFDAGSIGSRMSSISERLSQESIAQHQIRKRLAPLVVLINHMDSLYERAIEAITSHPRQGAAPKVGLILTTRLANDIRVCSLTSQLGYGLQALVLAGTVVEVVGALSYVGDDDTRAVKWAEHKNHRHTYPPKVVDGIQATLTALGISKPSANNNWQEAYTFMCMAKHANPFLSLLHGLRIDSSGAYYVHGPDVSDLGVMLSAQALWHMVGFGTAGIYVAVGHCSDDALKTKLRAETISISDHLRGLEPWFLEVIKPESPLKSQKETSALYSEVHRIQSETERLLRETEKIQQKTRRLKSETKKIRRTRSVHSSLST